MSSLCNGLKAAPHYSFRGAASVLAILSSLCGGPKAAPQYRFRGTGPVHIILSSLCCGLKAGLSTALEVQVAIKGLVDRKGIMSIYQPFIEQLFIFKFLSFIFCTLTWLYLSLLVVKFETIMHT